MINPEWNDKPDGSSELELADVAEIEIHPCGVLTHWYKIRVLSSYDKNTIKTMGLSEAKIQTLKLLRTQLMEAVSTSNDLIATEITKQLMEAQGNQTADD